MSDFFVTKKGGKMISQIVEVIIENENLVIPYADGVSYVPLLDNGIPQDRLLEALSFYKWLPIEIIFGKLPFTSDTNAMNA